MEVALIVVLLGLEEQVVLLAFGRRNDADVGDAIDATIGNAAQHWLLHLRPRMGVEEVVVGPGIQHAKRVINRPDATGGIA